MGRRAVRRGATALAGLVLVGGMVATLAAGPAGAGERFAKRLHMLALTNQDRESHDRADVRLSWALSRYARHHSLDMAAKGNLYHSGDGTLVQLLDRYDFSIGGENVGVGSSVDSLQAAFMQSPPHRENILRSSFDHVAIGMARVDGHLWVTVIFYG